MNCSNSADRSRRLIVGWLGSDAAGHAAAVQCRRSHAQHVGLSWAADQQWQRTTTAVGCS